MGVLLEAALFQMYAAATNVSRKTNLGISLAFNIRHTIAKSVRFFLSETSFICGV